MISRNQYEVNNNSISSPHPDPMRSTCFLEGPRPRGPQSVNRCRKRFSPNQIPSQLQFIHFPENRQTLDPIGNLETPDLNGRDVSGRRALRPSHLIALPTL